MSGVAAVRVAREHPRELLALLTVAAVGWWLTVQQMAGMSASPGADLGTLGWFTGTWVVMMAAMMLPSLTPTLAAYLSATRARGPGRSLLFTGGYVLVWAVAGIAVYGGFELGRHLLASELAWHRGGRWLSGAVLLVAAAYQLTPLKHVSQRHCRGELATASRASAGGAGPALRMGVRSGSWCLGSSWALMAALFALGAMSLTWMVVIAAAVALEKLSPWPRTARLAGAALLVVLAAAVEFGVCQ